MDSVNTNAWSPYAPVRWREEGWWIYGKLAAKQGLVRASGHITQSLPGFILRDLVDPLIANASDILEDVPEDQRGSAVGAMVSKAMELRHWVPLIGQYEANGRQIFDLHDCLTEALLNTDVGDCNLDGLKLPYDCFYLAFGKQNEIRVPWEDDFEYADGAFVAVTPWDSADGSVKQRFKVGLSTVKKDGSGVMMPGYFIDFTPDEAAMPVQQAINFAIERRKAAFHEGTTPGSQAEAIASYRVAELEEGAVLARKALLLVFNAMFYLESLSELPSESPGRDTSSQLSSKWRAAAPTKRHKLKSEITANGYTVVRLIGSEIADAMNLKGGRPDGVKTHWRRGFLRNQPYGPERSLIRRQWIKPTVVNASKGGLDDAPGHVYVPGGAGSH